MPNVSFAVPPAPPVARRVHVPVPGPEACARCRHFETVDGQGESWGACRRHAPVVAARGAGDLRGWPLVYAVNRCGDFDRAYDPPLTGA
ncbi:hypothetical protein OPKNFCMD_3832 [Methylobacterium crusticola]|uniref:Uracil-DNA glycosylase n=1 Tax=Methylobacterium crusticola TaxID=1697972 RepID=A0ABQ4R2L9_9HYPH|nr:hypothetical protein [Methylobacterium crusticola]GJD51081.1 hypothetical protein OPKNFCMD_3832 [Methylobacterium crusticola]